MIFTSLKVSAGGGEFSFFTEIGERYTISLADAKRLGLSELAAEDFPVEFEDDELILFLSSKLSAIKYGTYLLSFSDKSESALRRKMREKDYTPEVIDEALSVLREGGFTDDEILCLRKYLSLANSKLYGPHRIKSELFAKGFSASDIRLAEERCGIDFEELLRELLDKLLSSSRVDFSDRNAASKFKAKLSRYGYGYETVNSVLRDYCSDDGFDD